MDALRRQLLAAVRMWFSDDDPIAIHTLIYAAHEILHTQFRRRGFKGLLFDSPSIGPEYKEAWSKKLRNSANFFKHARADPDGSIDFDIVSNEMFLLFSIYGLAQIGEALVMEEQAFLRWIFVNRPKILKEGAYDGLLTESIEQLRGLPRSQFLQQYAAAFALRSGRRR
jgi:hypothetical protein